MFKRLTLAIRTKLLHRLMWSSGTGITGGADTDGVLTNVEILAALPGSRAPLLILTITQPRFGRFTSVVMSPRQANDLGIGITTMLMRQVDAGMYSFSDLPDFETTSDRRYVAIAEGRSDSDNEGED